MKQFVNWHFLSALWLIQAMAFIFSCVRHFKELVLVLKLHITLLNVNSMGCPLMPSVCFKSS